MAEPRVLLLDEPSLGLSPSAITTVTEFLDELRTESEVTLVILEQNAAFAARLANHGRTLRLGRLDPQALDRAQLAQLSTSE
jgi:branched-chain amino acid transport system ATP-binding protein